MTDNSSLHQGQPVRSAGTPLAEAQVAMICVHGRGASAEDILMLADELARPQFTYLAPQAANHTWYPYPFMEPLEKNEPWLSSALRVVGEALASVEAAGIPSERTLLLGFSQGACLTLEFAARNARRYGGLVGLSGGLIGPDGTPRDYPGSLAQTPVFLGCSNHDPHIPKERVEETSEVLARLHGRVYQRLYPDLGHEVNRDEIAFVRGMMDAVTSET
jgi:predicted esterase